jgi:GT2 family glycosyltransferase
MKLGIGIPTIKRFDLLFPCLVMYKNDFPNTDIYVVDNGKQNIKIDGIKVIEQDENLGVAGSWNLLANVIFQNNDNALILNDDIYFGKKLHELQDFIKKKKLKDKFIRATPDWCAFLLPKSVFSKVGEFDDVFYPAYYEDKSYEYRMKLKGISPVKSPFFNPAIYKSSQTMIKMPELQDMSKKNKLKYIEMWGGEPENEKYKIPYDGHKGGNN